MSQEHFYTQGNVPLFDSHTHLNADELFDNREKHIEEFIEAGGVGLVNIGANAHWADRGFKIAQQTNEKLATNKDFFIGSTIGIHPSEITYGLLTERSLKDDCNNLLHMYEENRRRTVAIGECGIDLHYEGAADTIKLQQDLFARQCQMALDTGLPLVIHSREGFQETIDVLDNFFLRSTRQQETPIVFHCFGYGEKEAHTLLSRYRNIYLGFDGNITYPSAQPLRDAFLITPIDKILLETDAPYLAPIPVRGRTNTPKNIFYTYAFLAKLRDIPLEDFANKIYENSRVFYNI